VAQRKSAMDQQVQSCIQYLSELVVCKYLALVNEKLELQARFNNETRISSGSISNMAKK
jgi:hypothetical protein